MSSAPEKQNQAVKAEASLPKRAPAHPAIQPEHPILNLQQTAGNQAVMRMLRPQGATGAAASESNAFHNPSVPLRSPAILQRKLAINEPGDIYEQEADRVSEHVMRMPASPAAGAAISGSAPGVQLKAAGPSGPGVAEAPPIVHEVLRSPGQPLDKSTRTFMEPRFGQDFSAVRVHTDGKAAESARAVQAKAYTVGRDVVFGSGEFAPGTHEGQRLLGHELTHVVQQGSEPALQRQPDPKASQAEEARLRVRIVDTLEATKRSAIDAVVSAIESGDRAYLEGLGLTSKQVDHLLSNSPQFDMMFGTAAELAVEKAVREDAFLSQYVKRGPVGRVPRGVGKPDWRIETPSSSIAVDLMTPGQVGKKLEMWRKQWRRGKPKWYIEKGLNITYERPSGVGGGEPPRTGLPAEAPRAAVPEVAQVATRISGLRSAGRFLAREAPGLILQFALMVLFPPSVNFHNEKAEELSRTKLDPAIDDFLTKNAAKLDKMMDDDPSQSLYANVTAGLDYAVDASSSGDLELYLKDVSLVEVKITHDSVLEKDEKFNQTGSRLVHKQVIYSILLYEPEYVTRQKEWEKAQKEYQECLQRYGTGSVPVAAGAEAASQNISEAGGPCIPPHMKPMEGP